MPGRVMINWIGGFQKDSELRQKRERNIASDESGDGVRTGGETVVIRL